MSIKKALSPKISHHAELILGGERSGEVALFTFANLGINEARILREQGQLAGARQITIRCETMTEEGQNALLKTLEEPAAGVKFVFLVPESIKLLSTLLSRFEVSHYENSESQNNPEIKKFVEAKLEDRFKIIEILIKKAGEETKGAALNFLTDLEKYLAKNIEIKKINNELIFALAEIRRGRDYLQDKSGTPKLILEHIALALPNH